MKFLLLLGVLGLLWWVWKKRQRSVGEQVPPPAPAAENMVVCAHCGVLMPESDGLKDGLLFYCSEAHRLAAGSTKH
ncbi:MAG: hypothetical protein H6R15_4489 [Proteobacteria bacterium]|nr:hypothetical protein [Pseudomonadota bacterium]